jgi:hypothetical protein
MKPYLVALIVLLCGSTAGAEPCAWVLWGVHESAPPYERSVIAWAAYSDREECLKGVRTLAEVRVEMSKHAPNGKGTRRVTELAGNERVETELKGGGSLSVTFMCFPHPVKPE